MDMMLYQTIDLHTRYMHIMHWKQLEVGLIMDVL
jgi:hypothetical protein